MKMLKKIIKHQRKELGFTQSDVAERLGISRTYYADMEDGRKKIDLKKAKALVGILKLDPLIFFDDDVA
jgi:transcriptional regulator with XRE-family HTH domain